MSDLISRGEVGNVLHNNLHALIDTDQLYQLYKDINRLPTYSIPNSAENKREWIPVSERLPKAYQKVLVTYEEIHWANEPTIYGVKLISFGGVVDFIAWQPLPEPYKAESEDK